MINKWFAFLMLFISSCNHVEVKKASEFKKDLSFKNFPVLPIPKINAEYEPKKFELSSLPPEFHQPFSCYITKKIPLRSVILTCAKKLNLSIYIDPTIQDKYNVKMKQEPFSSLIQLFCKNKNINYYYKNKKLYIEKDGIFTKTYSLSCLNIERSAQNNMHITTDVFSYDNSNQEKENSNSSVSMQSKSNFWNELEQALTMILKKDNYSLHKQTGIVSVKGTKSQHLMVEQYLNRLKKMLSAQVLIEAKVVEVHLKEQHKSGIEWENFANQLKISTPLLPANNTNNSFTLNAGLSNFSMILHALDYYGEINTLASPSIRVLNNHSAVLKVAQNQVYFKLNYDKHFFSLKERDSISVSSELHTVPIGLVLLVQPSIDIDNGKVMLFLRPTLSRKGEDIDDPAVKIMADASSKNLGEKAPSSLVPVVDVREIDSVLSVKSGEMAILGGLMDIRSTKEKQAPPILGELPGIKNAFTHNRSNQEVVELIIILRATIMS